MEQGPDGVTERIRDLVSELSSSSWCMTPEMIRERADGRVAASKPS